MFSCGPAEGEKLFDPWASKRKGRECPHEIRTKKFMFMLFFLPRFFLCAKARLRESLVMFPSDVARLHLPVMDLLQPQERASCKPPHLTTVLVLCVFHEHIVGWSAEDLVIMKPIKGVATCQEVEHRRLEEGRRATLRRERFREVPRSFSALVNLVSHHCCDPCRAKLRRGDPSPNLIRGARKSLVQKQQNIT